MGLQNYGPWQSFEQQRWTVEQHKENRARYASAYCRFNSTGWGEIAFPKCFEFGLTFTERPYVSYACSLDGDQLVDTRFPRSQGGVYKWKQDSRGFYTGAWCYAVVETQSPYIPTTEAEPKYSLEHDYTFNGLAFKALPDYLAEN